MYNGKTQHLHFYLRSAHAEIVTGTVLPSVVPAFCFLQHPGMICMDFGRSVLYGDAGGALSPHDPALDCSSGDVLGQHPKRRRFWEEPGWDVWKQALPANTVS